MVGGEKGYRTEVGREKGDRMEDRLLEAFEKRGDMFRRRWVATEDDDTGMRFHCKQRP